MLSECTASGKDYKIRQTLNFQCSKIHSFLPVGQMVDGIVCIKKKKLKKNCYCSSAWAVFYSFSLLCKSSRDDTERST